MRNAFESASMVLATIAVVSCMLIYISIPCGSLAIILGLLSRGGKIQFSHNAKVSIAIGALAMVITIVLYAWTISSLLAEYGSLEGILNHYAPLTGISYEELIELLNTQ